MSPFEFVLASLATWRLAALLVRDQGPFDSLARLRRGLAGTAAGSALGCFFCTSLWAAIPAAFWLVGPSRTWPVVWLAVGGAAGLLERQTSRPEPPRPLDLEEVAASLNAGDADV